MLILSDLKDRGNFTALLKILAILAIKLQGGKIGPLVDDIGVNNVDEARAFLKKYGADVKAFDNLFKNIKKKSTDVLPFAEAFVTNFRGVLNSNRLKHDTDTITADNRTVLTPLMTLLSNPDSTNALSTLNRKINLLHEPALTLKYSQVFHEVTQPEETAPVPVPKKSNKRTVPEPSAGSNAIDKISRQIADTIRQLTKDADATGLTAAQKEKASKTEAGQALLKQLTQLRKQLSDAKLNEIRKIVGSSGEQQISTEDLTRHLFQNGVKQLNIPPAFQRSDIVYVNLDGLYCDSEGRVAVRQGWQPGAEIVVNPSYSHDTPKKNWLFKVVTVNDEGKRTVNYVQTQGKVAEKRAARFQKVDEVLEQDIKSVKAKWRSSMKGQPDDERTVFANIAEFVYQTTSRIGSGLGETAGARTYGASNFLVKHVDTKVGNESRLKISYPIKSGKLETFVLAATASALGSASDVPWVKTLNKFILASCKGKKPDDLVFTVKGHRVNTGHFNSYLRSIDLPFTAKTFRTMRGTELAIQALNQAKAEYDRLQAVNKGKPLPQKTVNDLFKAAMSTVGELLGHVRRTKSGEEETTAMTAIKSYVNPKVMVDWYKSVGFAPLSAVTQAAKLADIDV